MYSKASLVAGVDYTLGLTLKGTTVSVTLNAQLILSRGYNALVTDGDFGLLGRAGQTSFDSATVKSDDAAFLDPSQALTAWSWRGWWMAVPSWWMPTPPAMDGSWISPRWMPVSSARAAREACWWRAGRATRSGGWTC